MKYVKLILASMCALGLGLNTAWAGGDTEAGKVKADANCAGCHGAAGEGAGEAPALAGMCADDHVAILVAYKDGSREGAMMQMFAANLSEEDMHDIAAYYASLGE